MMNGHEKSDPAIVAMNPTNNTGGPVEPRAGTKGNVDEQSMRRAQDRGSVSQALERVRNAARQRKKERFTSLYHHLTPELLRCLIPDRTTPAYYRQDPGCVPRTFPH